MSTDEFLLAKLGAAIDQSGVVPREPSDAELGVLRLAVVEEFAIQPSIDALANAPELAFLERVLAADASLPMEPSDEEMRRLGLEVANILSEHGAVRSLLADSTSPRSRLQSFAIRARRPLVATASVFGAVVLATGTAAATGHLPLPRPLAQIAHDVGLPVHSPAFDDAHATLVLLQKAVKTHDRTAMREALSSLKQEEKALDPGEFAQVGSESTGIVGQAEADLNAGPSQASPGAGSDGSDDGITPPAPVKPPSGVHPVPASNATVPPTETTTQDQSDSTATNDPNATTTTTAPNTTTTAPDTTTDPNTTTTDPSSGDSQQP